MTFPKRLWLWMILCFFSMSAQANLRFLLPPVSSPAVMYAAFTPLAKYLSQAVGQKVTLSFSANLENFYNEAEKPTAQIALFCPISYIRTAHTEAYQPLVGVTPTPGGNHSVIVVRKDSNIHTILQLRNQSFVMGDPACAASSLIPLSLFHEVGLTRKSFSTFRQSGSDQSALMDVAARFYDATAVAENVAAPYLRSGSLRIIARADVGPGDLLAASSEVPAAVRSRLTAALLQVDRANPAAIHALGGLAAGFQPVSDEDYNVLRTLYMDIHGIALNPKVGQEALTLGIPPTFTPLSAYRIFAPLQEALSRITHRPVQMVIPRNENTYVADGRKGRFDFALLAPKMIPAEKKWMIPLAESVPHKHEQGLAIIARDAPKESKLRLSNPLSVAYASPYCSGKSIATGKLHKLANGRTIVWLAVGSERAVLTHLADGKVQLGIVRVATITALEKELPGTWSIIQHAGDAPAWTLAANRQLPEELRDRVKKKVLALPAEAMSGTGFQNFSSPRS